MSIQAWKSKDCNSDRGIIEFIGGSRGLSKFVIAYPVRFQKYPLASESTVVSMHQVEHVARNGVVMLNHLLVASIPAVRKKQTHGQAI